MANLYEINKEITELLESNFGADEEIVNSETGEITTIEEKLNELEMDFNTKIENIACYIKNLSSDIAAIKEEEQRLAKRRRAKENLVESLKRYATSNLVEMGYNKFESPRACLSFRKSSVVVIDDGTKLEDKYLNIKVEPNKALLKEALQIGIRFDGVRIEERVNLQVK